MITPLKSYGFSLVVHATMIAALFAIPAASTQRFTSSGQTHVISLDASLGAPSVVAATVSVSEPLITMLPQPTSPISLNDSPLDPMASTESWDRPMEEALPDPLETNRPDMPHLAVPPNLPERKVETRPILKRREFSPDALPRPIVEVTPPRPRSSTAVSRPPAATSVPVEQFAGLEKKTSADLSTNQPPEYPVEAVRLKLQGVVLLRLHIAATGIVESVELIESSGHHVLDKAAIEAVARWEGEPARRWGRPTESIEQLPIRFRL